MEKPVEHSVRLGERVEAVGKYDVQQTFVTHVQRHENRNQVLDAYGDPAQYHCPDLEPRVS
eukprot:4752695-Pyramimonas_sp.AAC.1